MQKSTSLVSMMKGKVDEVKPLIEQNNDTSQTVGDVSSKLVSLTNK